MIRTCSGPAVVRNNPPTLPACALDRQLGFPGKGTGERAACVCREWRGSVGVGPGPGSLLPAQLQPPRLFLIHTPHPHMYAHLAARVSNSVTERQITIFFIGRLA